MKTKIIQFSCLLLIPLFGYLFTSCDAGVAEGNVGTQIEIDFAGHNAEFCKDFFDERHTLNMTITVDKIVDTDTGETEVHDTRFYDIDNNIGIAELYELDIPETGGFVIIVQATSNQCFSCCDGYCFSSGSGKPFLRSFRTFNGDPGGIILMELELLNCNCC